MTKLKTLSDRMRAVRHERGMTQADVSLLSGLAPSTVGSLEHAGHMPRADHAIRVARALGVQTDWLVAGEGTKDRYDI